MSDDERRLHAWLDVCDGRGRGAVLPALLAAALVAFGANLVVVGGTARRLRGDPCSPRDLDVILDGGASSLEAIASGLTRLGADAPPTLRARRSWCVATSLGWLDVMDVRTAGALPEAVTVDVAGVGVPVAVSA